MTLTTLCTSLIYPIMAFMGFLILAHVFDAPYLEHIDLAAFVITIALILLFASWGVALNYGVETI